MSKLFRRKTRIVVQPITYPGIRMRISGMFGTLYDADSEMMNYAAKLNEYSQAPGDGWHELLATGDGLRIEIKAITLVKRSDDEYE